MNACDAFTCFFYIKQCIISNVILKMAKLLELLIYY